MRTRKRDLKCPEFQIDETHCPCVEVEKCHLPVCPSGGVPKATQSCKLSATKTDHFDYGVSQCKASQVLNYANGFQLSVAGDATCDYCACDGQVTSTDTAPVCSKFDTDCDGLIWQDWGACVLPEGSTCGVGEQSRLRQCGGYTTFDDVKNMCYDPWVKRTGAGEMSDNLEYYESVPCVVACPAWGPWTPCSAVPGGVGVQMRFDQSDPSNQDVRQCSVGATGTKPDEVHYGPCNAVCGSGTRQKITYNFLGGAAVVTTEACDTGVACAAATNVCPGTGGGGVLPPVTNDENTNNDTPIIKPSGGTTGGTSGTGGTGDGTTINPVVEVTTAGVQALIGSIAAIIFSLIML